MSFKISDFIEAVSSIITAHHDEIAALDQAIGDGDHVINLQRGLNALLAEQASLNNLVLPALFSQMGLQIMSTMGGASGSLYGSLLVAMGRSLKDKEVQFSTLVTAFNSGVESVKARGKADIGEKTMLDTLIPAANALTQALTMNKDIVQALQEMKIAAETGMTSTRDMLATKGRASFLGDRARGHIDAGARSSQLMLSAIADVWLTKQA